MKVSEHESQFSFIQSPPQKIQRKRLYVAQWFGFAWKHNKLCLRLKRRGLLRRILDLTR